MRGIEEIRNDSMTLNMFWECEDGIIPRVVKLALQSWLGHGHNINIWTILGDSDYFDFDLDDYTDVNFISLRQYCYEDEIPFNMIYSQKKPLGKEGRYIAGFVDWCRFKIMSLFDECTIMDTDVILLKPFIANKLTFVCEESFRVENSLYNYYPCAGIIRSDKSLGVYLLGWASKNIHDGMPHGHLMKIIYHRCVSLYKSEFEMKSKGEISEDLDIIEHNQFFELGYDELELFYKPIERKTIRRLKDVTGIHCWMSLLDTDLMYGKYGIIDLLWKLVKVNKMTPDYNNLRFVGLKNLEENN